MTSSTAFWRRLIKLSRQVVPVLQWPDSTYSRKFTSPSDTSALFFPLVLRKNFRPASRSSTSMFFCHSIPPLRRNPIQWLYGIDNQSAISKFETQRAKIMLPVNSNKIILYLLTKEQVPAQWRYLLSFILFIILHVLFSSGAELQVSVPGLRSSTRTWFQAESHLLSRG